MSTINRVKKISVASVAGRLSAEEIAHLKTGASMFVGRFYGTADAVKKGVSQYGPWVALIGTFRGVNADGEIFQGPQLLLPLGICEAAADQLAQPDVERVDVVVDIFAKYKQVGAADGYEFFAQTQAAPEMEDPLALMGSKLPALPVPAKAEQLALAEVPTEAPAEPESKAKKTK